MTASETRAAQTPATIPHAPGEAHIAKPHDFIVKVAFGSMKRRFYPLKFDSTSASRPWHLAITHCHVRNC